MRRFAFIVLIVGLSLGISRTGFASDPLNRSGHVRFIYNARNQVTEIIGPGDRKINLNYNERGQPQTLTANNEKQAYEYDRLGLLKQVQDHTGTIGLKYDSNARLQQMSYPGADSVTYRYNEDGHIAEVKWNDKPVLRYDRDLLGNIVVMDTPAGRFEISYNYDKRIMQRVYPNGAFSQFTYNREGRPVLIQHAAPDKSLILEFRYVYNDAGLLQNAQEQSPAEQLQITYSYDAYGQLLQAAYSDGRRYVYTYDTFGNRLIVRTPGAQISATYDSQDRFTYFNSHPVQHDASGNVTRFEGTTFKYNAFDALIDDETTRYTYNALGLRVAAADGRGTARFVHLISDLPYVLAETGAETKRYLWTDGRCLGQIQGDRNTLFFFEDHLGSVRAAMDISGKITGYAEYAPFGEPLKRIPGVRFGFAGEEQDETGKVYLRARYYLPSIGRFLSKDPVLPQLMDEIKQNRYAYAANSPMNYTDRNGAYVDAESRRGSSASYAPIVTPPAQQENNSKPISYWNNAPPGGLYPLSPRMEIQMHYNDLVDKAAQRAADTAHSVPNVFGSKEKGHLVSENSPISVLLYNSPIFSHTALWHDAGIHGVGRDNPYFYTSMLASFAVASIHYAINYSGMPTQGLNNFLYDIGRKDSITSFSVLHHLIPVAQPTVNYFQGPTPAPTPTPPTSTQTPTPSPQTTPTPSPTAAQTPVRFPTPTPSFTPTPTSITTPNVGGIYLDKAAEVIGDLSDIEGVTFDPVTNRILLIGKDAKAASLPPFRLDDLAAAFRSVFGDYAEEPGVTIDPDPQDPMSEKMFVRFFGGMENTRFGMVLFEADRLMKALSLGEDNLSHQKVGAHIDGYYNLLDLSFSDLGGSYKKELWSRFWLVPDQMLVKVSDNKKSITFPSTRIRVKTETMRWDHNKLVPAQGEQDEKAEYFAAHFTNHYDDYAKEFPVYRELKTLTNLVGLAKWIKESKIPVDLTWLQKYANSVETPQTTPSLTVNTERRMQSGNRIQIQTASIFGGTDLTVNNAYVKDDGTSARYATRAQQAIASHPGLASETFRDEDQQIKRVVALPTSQTRVAGAKILTAQDLPLLKRVYCSLHNDSGPFGRSWFLDLPVLRISRPQRSKQEYVGIDNQRIMVQTFQLIGPFGLLNISFEKPEVDQQSRRIAFLPDIRAGIRALYPDPNKGEYRIEYEDGSAMIFDTRGRIARVEQADSLSRHYSYDPAGKLAQITLKNKDQVVDLLKFSYDPAGRIASAKTLREKIDYQYDAGSHLIKVISAKNTIEYAYDTRHLVTGILENGKSATEFAYDEWGRLVFQKTADGKVEKPQIKTDGALTGITEGADDRRITRYYDAGGRLLEIRNPSGSKIALTYHDNGSPKIIEYKNTFGDITKIEYAPDNRSIKYIDSEGHVWAIRYDEFGRIEQVWDGQHTIVSNQYGQTDQGWAELTETSEFKTQTLFNATKNPGERMITSKIPRGGQLITKNEYDTNGHLRRLVTQGIVQAEYIYQEEKLIKQTTGNEQTAYAYTNAGQISQITSGKNGWKFLYESTGGMKSMTARIGQWEQVYGFSNGRLVERTDSNGLKDTFQYDSEGTLQLVRRNDTEQWEVQRIDKRITYLRNDVVHIEYLLNDAGRIEEVWY